MQPRSHVWNLNGLDHHVLEWSAAEGAKGPGAGATALVVHGFQDAAATWDDVAGELAAAGFRVLAPDMRGFGDGARIPPGGYYFFPHYVSDLAGVAAAHANGAPVFLIGHSMGATVVTYYAGAFPERVTKLALIDGVGPPNNEAELAPTRMRRWIEMTYESPSFDRKPMTPEDALSRLVRFNPDIDKAVLARHLPQLARDVPGGLAWKGDLLHNTTSPLPFYAEAFKAFARAVACPVLHVSGGKKGHHVEDEEERLAAFPSMKRVTIEGGHALHWSKPKELGAALVGFWRG